MLTINEIRYTRSLQPTEWFYASLGPCPHSERLHTQNVCFLFIRRRWCFLGKRTPPIRNNMSLEAPILRLKLWLDRLVIFVIFGLNRSSFEFFCENYNFHGFRVPRCSNLSNILTVLSPQHSEKFNWHTFELYTISAVSYTHLTLPTIYSV